MNSNVDQQELKTRGNASADDMPESKFAGDVEPGSYAELITKRGRLITSALLVTIILTFIAVAVAGIFQMTVKFMQVCPAELPVNDPAPVLWNDITSEKAVKAITGVPEKLKQETALKALTNASN